MLEARGLGKVYRDGPRRVDALANVDLTVRRGEFVAVRGRSGSGKSTLLALLGTLTKPSAGTVLLDGGDVWNLSPHRLADVRGRRLGFLFQFAGLLPALRVIDNVALPGLLAGGTHAGVTARAEKLLRDVGLADRATSYPDELSGGEQRRVALARALINEPDLLLADEPTSDLDEATAEEVFGLLLELRRARGSTLIVATHDSALAALADRVVHLRDGRVVHEEAVLSPGRTDVGPRPTPAAALPVPAAEPLGSGFGRSLVSIGVWMTAMTLTLITVNFGASLLQHNATQARQEARQKNEAAALSQLRADVEDLAFGPDGDYRLTLYLQNGDPTRDLIVTAPAISVFVQVGGGWREVPARPMGHEEGRALTLTGRERFVFTFQPGALNFEETLPGYMHVRIANSLLVSPGGVPGGELFERSDNYYVWLLPRDADLERVSKLNSFPGKPPVWIPMPSH